MPKQSRICGVRVCVCPMASDRRLRPNGFSFSLINVSVLLSSHFERFSVYRMQFFLVLVFQTCLCHPLDDEQQQLNISLVYNFSLHNFGFIVMFSIIYKLQKVKWSIVPLNPNSRSDNRHLFYDSEQHTTIL